MTNDGFEPAHAPQSPLWPVILIATVAGAIVRAAPVLRSDFPLNDGGLFASMVDDVVRTGQPIPAVISYNQLGAPFAYPPLAFGITALLESVVRIGTVEWLRWIPLAASIAMIPAFALVASRLAATRTHVAVATFAFAMLPRSFEWMVMGGGLTRAPGFVAAITTVYLGIRFLQQGDRTWIGAGILLGLTLLTHPEAGLFAIISLGLAVLLYARSRRAWIRAIAAGGIGGAVLSPWLVTVLARHGIAPLMSAGATGANLVGSVFYLLTARLTEEPFLTLLAGLAVLGFVFALSRRQWLVPIWAVALALADPRGAATYAAVPIAILAASGLLDVVVARIIDIRGPIQGVPGWPGAVLHRGWSKILVGGSLSFALLTALLAPYVLSPMSTVSGEERAAMAWSRTDLPSLARVVVISGRSWYEDASAEWFPYLAERLSVATVQGYEWLGSAKWQRQLDIAAGLQQASGKTITDIDDWARQYGISFDYVFVPKGRLGGALSSEDCCSAVRQTLRASPDYQVVYDGAGATIARRVANVGASRDAAADVDSRWPPR